MAKKNEKKKNTDKINNHIAENESLGKSESKRLDNEVNSTKNDVNFKNFAGNIDIVSLDSLMANVDMIPVETLRKVASSGALSRKDLKIVNKAIKNAEKGVKDDFREQKKFEKAVKSGKFEEDPGTKLYSSYEEVEEFFLEREGDICRQILDNHPQFLKDLILSSDKELIDFVCYINKGVFTKVNFNALHVTYDANKIDNFKIIARELLADENVLNMFKNASYKDGLNLLEVAIADGKNEYVEALLNNNYPLDNFHNDEYIMQAINANNLGALKSLANHGANLDIRYEDGSTLLQRLATVNDMDKFMALLIRGADYESTNLEGQDLITYLHNNNRNDFRAAVLQHIKNGGNSEYNENFRLTSADIYEESIANALNMNGSGFEKKATSEQRNRSTFVGSTDDALRIQNENTKLELEKMKFQNKMELEKMKLDHERMLQEQKFSQLQQNFANSSLDESEGNAGTEQLSNSEYDRNRAMRVKKVSQYVSPHMIPDPDRARRIREELKSSPRPINSNLTQPSDTRYGKMNNQPYGSRPAPLMNQGYGTRMPNRANTRSTSGYTYQSYMDRLASNGIGVDAPNDVNHNNEDFGYEERIKYDLLRHLKILFDEEVITYDEYVLEKSKILGHFEQ